MANPDIFDEPFDVRLLAKRAAYEECRGRRMVKLGFASYIIDASGDVLVAAHVARDGEFEHGALGPIMETFQYVPERGRFGTETPAEVFQRSLSEEIDDFGEAEFDKAGFYFDRKHPVINNEWRHKAVFAQAVSLIVRVENPELLIRPDQCSDELIWTDFMPVAEILGSSEPMRPGYIEWLQEMQRIESLPASRIIGEPLKWQSFPQANPTDVRYPYSGL